MTLRSAQARVLKFTDNNFCSKIYFRVYMFLEKKSAQTKQTVLLVRGVCYFWWPTPA